MTGKTRFYLVTAAVLILPAWGQVGMRAGTASTSPASSAVPAPAQPAVAADVSPILMQIQSAAQSTTADVSLLGIRRWKVGNDVKNDAQTKAEAIQRNLTVALPGMIAQVQNAPADLLANFKLYRTMSVLYDVMSSLAESAGAFGTRSEFDGLASDLNRMDQARRALGDRLEMLASAKDAEIVRLQNQIKAERAAAAATAQPKKIIVDEDDSAHKKSAKKPAAKKKPPAGQTQPTNPQ